ncbi:MAG: hypothetical protein H7039_24150 [Bryobacteraceae bacterium]|nr:hypothetical protein [Bryobacteraceae bacterium]
MAGRMANGVLYSGTWSKTGGEHQAVRLSGTGGTLDFMLYRANSWRFTPAGAGGAAAYIGEAKEYASQLPDIARAMQSGGDLADSYRLQWLDFAEAIRVNREPSCSFEEAARAVKTCCTIVPATTAEPEVEALPADSPVISVILSVQGDWRLARRTVGHLRAQTICAQIELVLMAVSHHPITIPDGETAGFHSLQMIPMPPDSSVAQANAAGTRAASAPVVVFAEDHCFPEPDWAAALLNAHTNDYAAVGPEISNANPDGIVSWCDYLVGYGPWMSPCSPGQVPFLPGHNSSYKRAILLEYGERLEAMLEAETVLHYDLLRQGRKLYLEPAARASHVNFALWNVWLPVQFHCGRVFGGSRAQGWPLSRKLIYTAASPLIPLVRTARICRFTERALFYHEQYLVPIGAHAGHRWARPAVPHCL